MALIVTGVGFLIHVYSLGYMAHDHGFQRFFTYLNLFIFAMMTLVLGENLLMLFVGWEGVGLCSYLLISFWFDDEANAAAGKKAFVVNRIGDFGFLLGMFLIGRDPAAAPGRGRGRVLLRAPCATTRACWRPAATAIALLLFLGATGKSAQIPLYIWLPDAMAGPTPVSRPDPRRDHGHRRRLHDRPHEFPLRADADGDGAWWRSWARPRRCWPATIALAQNDIKKVLAYSTVSQLGYMMLACGVGAFAVGIFHVMTHAFFKALLFLGSGSVIHAMSNEQDMRVMGGLRGKLPITCVDLPGRHPGHRRRVPPGRLLLQGRDPLEDLQQRQHGAVGRRLPGRRADRLLHDAPGGADLLRQQPGQRRGQAPHPRVAADDDGAAGGPGVALDRRRLGGLPRLHGRWRRTSSTGWRRSSPRAGPRRPTVR